MFSLQLNLSQDDATYSLTVELPAPIEFVLLQSNAPLQLIDVEKSSAVVSFSTCDPSVRYDSNKTIQIN